MGLTSRTKLSGIRQSRCEGWAMSCAETNLSLRREREVVTVIARRGLLRAMSVGSQEGCHDMFALSKEAVDVDWLRPPRERPAQGSTLSSLVQRVVEVSWCYTARHGTKGVPASLQGGPYPRPFCDAGGGNKVARRYSSAARTLWGQRGVSRAS